MERTAQRRLHFEEALADDDDGHQHRHHGKHREIARP
jgi:hypothetical protein